MQIELPIAGGSGKALSNIWDGSVTPAGGPPPGAVTVSQNSANVANAQAQATLAAAAGLTNFVTGFMIFAGGATAGSIVLATITGLAGGTLNIPVAVPAGALLAATPITVTFPQPIQASAVNTAVVLTLPALGAGNTNGSVSLLGFQR